MVKINADINKKGDKISKQIYGHFSEHLGRCIYEGLYVGENSDIPNKNGMRKDVVEALKNIKVPVLRWPGGCFADTYHWRDGIGANRKRIVNTCWGDVVEDNSFGTHEFFELCDQLGCETYINGNVGTGTLQEMCDWIEYMTFDGESPLSLERASNGHKEPWKIDYFGVGNESWGFGGFMTPEYYGGMYRHYQTFLKQYNSDHPYKKVCVGPNEDDYKWTEEILKNCFAYPQPEGVHGFMDVLTLHYYVIPGKWEEKGSATDFTEGEFYTTMRKARKMDELITKHSEILDKYDPEGKISFAVDEWGCWLDVEEGTNPGFLYQQNTMRDALVASTTFDIFNKHCKRVKLACLAQMVNVLQAVVLTDKEKIILTPTYHVFDMYKVHQDATFINMELTDIPKLKIDGEEVEAISGTISTNEAEEVNITLTNISLIDDIDVELMLDNVNSTSSIGKILTGEKDAYNTFDKPDNVVICDFSDYKYQDGMLNIKLPACSIVQIVLKK